MKRAFYLWVLCLALLFAGCASVVSVRPLYLPSDLEHPLVDPRVAGDWVLEFYRGPFVAYQAKIVSPNGGWGGSYSAEFHRTNNDPKKTGEEETYNYNFYLVRLGGKVYFDAEFSESKQGASELRREDLSFPLVAPAHFVGRLSVESDYLRVEVLNPEWIGKNVPEATRESASIEEYTDVVTLTGSTEELRGLIVRNADSPAFLPMGYLCRQGKDCEALAMDDLVRYWPAKYDKDAMDGILESAVEFWTRRKNYDRALELQRQLIGAEPGSWSNLRKLAELQMLKRDFSGAKRSLSAALQAEAREETKPKTSVGELLEWACFLDGAYEEVLSVAQQNDTADLNRSGDPILLSYFALIRLGRRSEAEEYLREKSAMYKGDLAEHALLLSALDRRTDHYLPDERKNEEERRSWLFAALNRLKTGDTGDARWCLNSTIDKAPGDSLMALAAQIELERLGPPPQRPK